jgi:hypothetical protein
MHRTWRVFFFFTVLTGVLGWLVLQPASGVRADPKNTKPCGNTVCSVNELCCVTGCPPQNTCLPRRVGKCPPPLPCPEPASTSTLGPIDSGE